MEAAGVEGDAESVASGCAGFSIVELATAGEDVAGVADAVTFAVAAIFAGAAVGSADARDEAGLCATVCGAALGAASNFQAINVASPTSSTAAAPNPAIRYQTYFGNEALDVATLGCGRAASRG